VKGADNQALLVSTTPATGWS